MDPGSVQISPVLIVPEKYLDCLGGRRHTPRAPHDAAMTQLGREACIATSRAVVCIDNAYSESPR
jgi:hypothetical protein